MKKTYYILKICGLTRMEDARLAANCGADFLGFVLHPPSPRLAPTGVVRQAAEELRYRPRVLVFGKDPDDYIRSMCGELADDMTFIQMPAHHPSLNTVTKHYGAGRVLPAYPVKPGDTLEALGGLESYPLILLDTGGITGKDGKVLDGGTGQTFDWELVKNLNRPYLAAGGINPDNILDAIEKMDCAGFDVSSGIEKSPGQKDHEKMRRLLERIKTGIK